MYESYILLFLGNMKQQGIIT